MRRDGFEALNMKLASLQDVAYSLFSLNALGIH